MPQPSNATKAMLLVLLVAAAAKVNSLVAVFAWDDDTLVVDNPHIHSLRHVPGFFLPSYWRQQHMAAGEVYRPIRLASFAVDYALWGLRPWGYHLTNLLLHLVNVLLVCVLLRKWEVTRPFWVLAALLFAVRPADVETVVWIKNRSDLFAAAFFFGALAALHLPLGRERQWGRVAASAALFACALMSKAVAVVLPALLMLVLSDWRRWRRAWAATIPFWVVAVGYMAVRALFLVTPPSGGELGGPGVADRLCAAVGTLAAYVRLAVLPLWQTLDHLPPWRTVASSHVVHGLALAAVACVCAVRWREGWRGALWFVIALAPVSNLIPLRDRPLAEQRLYVAALGLSIVLAAAGKGRRRAHVALLCAAVIGSAAFAVHRAGLWSSNLALWRAAVRVTPQENRPLSNFGNAYLWAGRLGRAETEYRRTLRASPKSYEARLRLGQVYEKRREFDRAMESFRQATALFPRSVDARYSAAALCQKRRRWDEAIELYRQIIAVRPNSPRAWQGLAAAYDQRGETQRAIEACTHAIALDPACAHAYRMRGVLLTPTDPARAVQDLTAAIENDPAFNIAYVDRARAYARLGDFARAQQDLEHLLQLDPDNALAWEELDKLRRGPRE